MKIRQIGIGALLIAGLLFTACGDSNSSSSTNNNNEVSESNSNSVTLSYNPKDEVINYEMKMKLESKGSPMPMKMDYALGMKTQTSPIKENKFEIENSVTSIKMEMSAGGRDINYDSNDPSTANSPMAAQMKPMLNQPYTLTLDEKGQVVDTKIEDLVKANPTMNQFSDNFATSLVKYPDTDLKIGDSWTEERTTPNNGQEVSNNITYTLKEIKTDVVILDMKIDMTVNGQLPMKGTSTGEIVVNRETGFTNSMKTIINMKPTINMPQANMEISTTMEMIRI